MIIEGRPKMVFERTHQEGFKTIDTPRFTLNVTNKNGKISRIYFDYDGEYHKNIISKITTEDTLLHFINSLYNAANLCGHEKEISNLNIDALIKYINSLNYIKIDFEYMSDELDRIKVISIEEQENNKLVDLFSIGIS